MTKIAGSGSESESGSICQRHGSADLDPEPHQNVMDPQHRNRKYLQAMVRYLARLRLALRSVLSTLLEVEARAAEVDGTKSSSSESSAGSSSSSESSVSPPSSCGISCGPGEAATGSSSSSLRIKKRSDSSGEENGVHKSGDVDPDPRGSGSAWIRIDLALLDPDPEARFTQSF
jgi:hypothetical protein